jgi:histone demethylase JARID1
MYVGMAFSSFCWHNEDNYLYSINYMHAGNTKVWYGVPGVAASQFEHVFAEKVPELFNSDRNLLYRLTTMINPSTFVAAGVKVTRALHTPGTFIVTFPQAYHAGFSIGWNIAEAVNFATIDWLKWGRQSELVYMSARRQSVLSVDHLSALFSP